MDRQEIIRLANRFLCDSGYGRIGADVAISGQVVGLELFDPPLFAFGSAADPLFERLKDPDVIGPHFLLPGEWLPQARTVISFFLPFSAAVRDGNRQDMDFPSAEWLHGRIEGQELINRLTRFLVDELARAGCSSVAPSLDSRFRSGEAAGSPVTPYTSNWSERHVAYVCGLGTFGLSRGLITARGVAGRFSSVITDLHLEPDKRLYSAYDEYCSWCGACARNCPAGAITLELGKNHEICDAFLEITRAQCRPRYGCGKCQVAVPCERAIPGREET